MSNESLAWDDAATEKLKQIPAFVRKMAKNKIEQAAKEAGLSVVTLQFMEESRAKLMK